MVIASKFFSSQSRFLIIAIEVFLITIKVPDHCIEIQVKDVRVPAQLMRAMAAEAEAAREARAKVIIIIIIMIIYCKSY